MGPLIPHFGPGPGFKEVWIPSLRISSSEEADQACNFYVNATKLYNIIINPEMRSLNCWNSPLVIWFNLIEIFRDLVIDLLITFAFLLSRHVLTVSDFQILIKSCSIETRNDPKSKKWSGAWNKIQFKDLLFNICLLSTVG